MLFDELFSEGGSPLEDPRFLGFLFCLEKFLIHYLTFLSVMVARNTD